MNQIEAINKFYANQYVRLDAYEHDYDDINSEIPNDIEDNKLFDTLYSAIIKPIEKKPFLFLCIWTWRRC